MRRSKTPALVVALLVLLIGVSVFSIGAQEAELLNNPGFEPPFGVIAGTPPLQVAEGWLPWFVGTQPEFYAASDTTNGIGLPRALEGDAQQWFTWYATHVAGVYQTVSGLTAGETYTFSANAYVWSSNASDRDISAEPGGVIVQVGIDPEAGTSSESPSIVWSAPIERYDAFNLYAISATASGDTATVWVRSTVTTAVQFNVVYVDNASFIAGDAVEATAESTDDALATAEVTDALVLETAEAETPLAEITPLPTEEVTEAVVVTEEPTATAEPTLTETEEATPTVEVIVTDEPTVEIAAATEEVTEVVVMTEEPTATATLEPTATETPTQEVIETEEPTATLEPTLTETATTDASLNLQQTATALVGTATANAATVTPTPTTVVIEPTATSVGIDATATPSVGTAVPPTATATINLTQYPFTITHTVTYGDTVYELAQFYRTSTQAILQANGLDSRGLIFIGQALVIPLSSPPAGVTVTVQATATPLATLTRTPRPTPTLVNGCYFVRPGETLGIIAARFNTTVNALARINNIVNINLIYVGQCIRVVSTVTPTVVAPVPTATTAAPTGTPVTYYSVLPGDTLFLISLRFNVSIASLVQANAIQNPHLIYVGQRLIIPGR